MGEPALAISYSGSCTTRDRPKRDDLASRAPTTSLGGHFSAARPTTVSTALAAILIALQIADGILTYLGVYTFGVSAEGNPLLRYGMHSIGPVATLIVAKGAAILIIVALWRLTTQVRWLNGAMAGVSALYLGAAILPWSLILSKVYLA